MIVVFTENNARILYTDNPSLWEKCANAVVEADISEVQGLPPHFWKRDPFSKKILPMNDAERAYRLAHHGEYGVINELPKLPEPEAELQTITQPMPHSTLLERLGLYLSLHYKPILVTSVISSVAALVIARLLHG
jgi:hypothetical protein